MARIGLWRHRVAAGSTILSVALLLPLLTSSSAIGDLPRPITVYVKGQAEYVPPGTTFEAMVERFHLHTRNGNLVAVDGRVLARDRYPGSILLNGDPQPLDRLTAALTEGDRIGVRNGHDRREQVFLTQYAVPPGTPFDPQRTLATAAGVITVSRGAMSGDVLSWRFQQTDPSVTPNAVALTFDDGPWPGSTERILAVLAKFHVQATFFTIGNLAERYPQLVEAETSAGMVIGDHSWDHPEVPPFGSLPPDRARSEISRPIDALALAGVRPTLFRPPGGSYGAITMDVARSLGLRVVLWSVDPADWTPGITTKAIVRRVLSNVRAGSIVLLHDGGGDRSATVKALPAIIKGIRARHLDLVALSP
jgi:peptidoglycan/xylan/chitin deacetylase (PgdA/CDA1 family)/sulfur carrier protein ThiS